MLRMIPSVVLACHLGEINPYAKFGLVIGNGYVTYEMVDNAGGNITETVTKLNGSAALGLSSAIGAIVKLNKLFSVFGELNGISLTYSPAKSEITKYTYLGADLLPNLTVCEKEKKYVSELIYDYDNPSLESEPTRELKHSLPFGSFGFSVGLRISL